MNIITPKSLEPGRGHYMLLTVKTADPDGRDHPYGTAAVKWDPGAAEARGTCQERFKLYIDGSTHRYHIPLGANGDWYRSVKINNIVLELPDFEGIEIELLGASLRKRIFFPIDTYLSGLAMKPHASGYIDLNRFLIPSYVFLLIFLILAGIYYLLFRKISFKGTGQTIIVKRAVFIFILLILVFFSGTYIYQEVITIRSYWRSYGDDLASGSIDDTYLGTYDFERFITWVAGVIPDDQNIILFIKGEPVYTMSEMAYNLYPRDIRFINIIGKTNYEINAEIEYIKSSSVSEYDYLIVLSRGDAWLASSYGLMARFRSTGGYIYDLR
jgi:hypothetical protein